MQNGGVIADATTGDVAATIIIIAAGTLTQTIPKTGIPVSKFTNAGMLMASAQDATQDLTTDILPAIRMH